MNDFTADIIAEDIASTPTVYSFRNGEIWSALGGDHPLSIGGALETLADLRRKADPASRLYWPNACHSLSQQLADAIADYRNHWTKQLELAR